MRGGVCKANEVGVFEQWRGGEPVNALYNALNSAKNLLFYQNFY